MVLCSRMEQINPKLQSHIRDDSSLFPYFNPPNTTSDSRMQMMDTRKKYISAWLVSPTINGRTAAI